MCSAHPLALCQSERSALQVWVGIQEGDNRLMGVLVIDETGVTHNYVAQAAVVVETSHMPSENPWAGWTIFESTVTNNVLDDGNAYRGRITLVCG